MRVFWGVFIFFLTLPVAARFEVRIQELSTVRALEPVKLGLLSDLDDVEESLQATLFDVLVYPKVEDGKTVELTSQEVATALRQRLSFQDLQKVAIRIPEIIKIQGRRNYLPLKEISFQIKSEIRRNCRGCDIVIDEIKTPDVSPQDEILGYRIDFQTLKPGSSLLPLQMQSSRGAQTYWVPVKTTVYKEAPVAKRLIRAGERLSQQDFEMRRVNVTHAKDGVFEAGQVEGQLAVRMLTVGQTIFATDLRKEPSVVRGQTVKVLLGNDDIEISTSAVAEDSGYLGETVRVRNLETKKILSGQLVEKGVVKIQ